MYTSRGMTRKVTAISSFIFLIICMNYPKIFVETNIKFGVGEKEFVNRDYLHCCDGVKQAK